MPYTEPHNVLNILGDITSEGEVEQFSMTLRFAEGEYLMGQDTAPVASPEDDVLDDIQTAIETWWVGAGAIFANRVRLTSFKFNAVDVQGKRISQTDTFQRDFTQPLAGGATTMVPPQIAIAATFRTAAARGLAARGRIYLPPVGASALTAEGRLLQPTCQDLANSVSSLLTDLSDWSGLDNIFDPGKVCVMSKVRLGATRRVNRVDVGDLFDTIRSRRSSLEEHRSSEVVVNS